jgi:putative SOS response-associated peptidase YedK
MCYSAMIEAEFRKYIRKYGLDIDIRSFARLYEQRLRDKGIKIPRALDANFDDPQSPEEKRVKECIDEFRNMQEKEWEAGLFAQITRLNNAERALSQRETKRALEDKRISTSKIAWFREKLAELNDPKARFQDFRIFPFWYGPVMVMDGGSMVLKLMRYHCRPAGKPASCDQKYDGLYNARRDSLERFWKQQFGNDHAVMVATGFYEMVALHDFEHRKLRAGEKPRSVTLFFNPRPEFEMNVACVWSEWQGKDGETLQSFAAVSDEPPAEIAASGHDRCVIPLKDGNVKVWLNPRGMDKQKLYSSLDDRERPYYEHKLAA